MKVATCCESKEPEPAFLACECSTWERVSPRDLRMGQHHTACPKWKPSYYVRVKLEGAGTYTLPLDDLGALQADLHAAAADGDTKATFTITLVDMTPYEYEQLPEFTGH